MLHRNGPSMRMGKIFFAYLAMLCPMMTSLWRHSSDSSVASSFFDLCGGWRWTLWKSF